MPSDDLMGSGLGRHQCATKALGFADGDLTDLLAPMLEAVSPEDYARQKAAFDTGHWVQSPLPSHRLIDRLPGGCMLNRATLYKLQTPTH